MGNGEAGKGAGALVGTTGGVGAAEGGLCANTAELNASPRAVIRRDDGMYIGNTSALYKASRVPFIEAAKDRQLLHNRWFGPSRAALSDRNPNTSRVECGQRDHGG